MDRDAVSMTGVLGHDVYELDGSVRDPEAECVDEAAAYVCPYVSLPGAAIRAKGQVTIAAAYDAVREQAVLPQNYSGISTGHNTTITSPRSSVINNKRANRVSLITSRSLYNIHEPEQDPSALGLDLHGSGRLTPEERTSTEWHYDPYLARSTESPASAVPSLTFSSHTSSAGYSTGCSTPVARRADLAPIEVEVQTIKKEKRVGKALLGKLKSFLLAPKSPSSAECEIKQATKIRQRLRRSRRAPPPPIEERSSSLYRTVDIPDPLDFAPTLGNRRASVFCSGPYGNFGAYNTKGASTASVAFGLPQSAYASVADFRHYSTADLPYDPTVPYSPYTEARESARFSALITSPVDIADTGDLELGTDKVKLKEKDWTRRSKHFWSSALDLTLPRSNHFSTMSTVELASPRPERATGGLVPAPPIPARSRLRGAPSSGNIKRDAASSNTTPTPRTPTAHLPSSPSDSSIGSTSSSSGKDVYSPGVPLTPSTPAINGTQYPSLSRAAGNAKAEYGFGDYLAHGAAAGPSVWPGKLEHSPTSPMAPPAAGQPKRSRFSRGSRHSSSGSVSLSASSDPLRVKDGVAPRGSASGIYTPPTFPGPSPRPSMHGSTSSISIPMNPAIRSASGSSETSYSTASSSSIPQTRTSPSAAASRMYTACMGALSGWSIGAPKAKRAPQPSDPQHPVHVDAAPMSAPGAYFPAHSSMTSRNSSFSHSSKHQASRSVSYTYAQEAQGPIQVWSPHTGWTGAAHQAGLGVGVEEEGNYVHGRTRSSTSATTGAAVVLADAPKGRRKPVPRAEGADEEVHAL